MLALEDQIAEPTPQQVTGVLTKLGIQTATAAQQQLVLDALTKAGLRWAGFDVDPRTGRRHSRYKTIDAWFRAEWVPNLRRDLDKALISEAEAAQKGRLNPSAPYDRIGHTSLAYADVYAILDEHDVGAAGYSIEKADVDRAVASIKRRGGVDYDVRQAMAVEAKAAALKRAFGKVIDHIEGEAAHTFAWAAVPASLVRVVKDRWPILTELHIEEAARTVHSNLPAHGLTWTAYGQGLQAEFEAAVLASLAHKAADLVWSDKVQQRAVAIARARGEDDGFSEDDENEAAYQVGPRPEPPDYIRNASIEFGRQ